MSPHTATFTEDWFDPISQDRLAELGRQVAGAAGIPGGIGDDQGEQAGGGGSIYSYSVLRRGVHGATV